MPAWVREPGWEAGVLVMVACAEIPSARATMLVVGENPVQRWQLTHGAGAKLHPQAQVDRRLPCANERWRDGAFNCWVFQCTTSTVLHPFSAAIT